MLCLCLLETWGRGDERLSVYVAVAAGHVLLQRTLTGRSRSMPTAVVDGIMEVLESYEGRVEVCLTCEEHILPLLLRLRVARGEMDPASALDAEGANKGSDEMVEMLLDQLHPDCDMVFVGPSILMVICKKRLSMPSYRWAVTTLRLLVVVYNLSVRFSRPDVGVEIRSLVQHVLAEKHLRGLEETLAYRCAVDLDSGTGMPDFRSREARLVNVLHFGSDTDTTRLTENDLHCLDILTFFPGNHLVAPNFVMDRDLPPSSGGIEAEFRLTVMATVLQPTKVANLLRVMELIVTHRYDLSANVYLSAVMQYFQVSTCVAYMST